LGSLPATASAPIEPMRILPSVMFFQVIPASSVFQTPPPVAPM